MENLSYDEIVGFMDSLSNWGRWGTDDQLGTLNLIGPEHTRNALGSLSEGEVVSCSRVISPKYDEENRSPLLHLMTASGDGAPESGEGTAADWFGLGLHGYSITHIDGLSHLFWNRRMYNNKPASDVSTAAGASSGSVEVAKDGFVSRGVLLDIPGAMSKPWLEPGEFITVADIEEAEDRQGVKVGEGDILLVRTGRDARRKEKGLVQLDRDGAPGLHASCLPWIRDRAISVLGSDSVHDAFPSGVPGMRLPIHTVCLVAMGLWLIDNAYLEALLEKCQAHKRFDFMMVISPLLLQGSTGSPVNPLAMF